MYANADRKVLGDDEVFEIFEELRDFEEHLRQTREDDEQTSASEEQRTKKRNILKSDRVMAWIESEKSEILWIDGNYVLSRTNFLTSFAMPVAIDAACNYEVINILKHFPNRASPSRNTCSVLLQALIAQLFKQDPGLFGSKESKLPRSDLREAGRDVLKLWNIFTSSLSNSNADRIYIILDGVDELRADHDDDFTVLTNSMAALVGDNIKLIKILLTARVLPNLPTAPDMSNSLSLPRRWSLVPFKNELLTMQNKFSEINEGRCREITFAQIILLYPPKTVVFTKEDYEYRAFVVHELSGMSETMEGRFEPLHLRVWSIDHNGRYFARRYFDLIIRQFSGSKSITDLQYIPARYLPKESEVRSQLAERGRKYWMLGEKPREWLSKGVGCPHHPRMLIADLFY